MERVGDLTEIEQRHFTEEAMSTSASLSLLWDYNPALRREVSGMMSLVHYEDGTSIPATSLHVIHSGSVDERTMSAPWKVPKKGQRKNPTSKRKLGPGTVFGEQALLSSDEDFNKKSREKPTTYVAQGATTCMAVSRKAVHGKADEPGLLAMHLQKAVEWRQRKWDAASISFESFHPETLIGVGTFSTVYLAVDQHRRHTYALKCLSKTKIFMEGQIEHTISECRLLNEMDHPFIVRLVRAYEDTEGEKRKKKRNKKKWKQKKSMRYDK